MEENKYNGQSTYAGQFTLVQLCSCIIKIHFSAELLPISAHHLYYKKYFQQKSYILAITLRYTVKWQTQSSL